MVWVLVLHISAVLVWCAALFYLPVLLCERQTGASALLQIEGRLNTLERLLFTHLATPAALVAILSGTVVFLLNRTLDSWLIAKLSLVTGLVICHALLGLWLMQWESSRQAATGTQAANSRGLRCRCRWLLGALSLVVTAILWLVLSKPALSLAEGG